MNRNRAFAVILSLIISISLFFGLNLSTARGPIPHHRGTFDTWYGDVNAKIVESSWSVTYVKDRAIFVAKFTELNIAEEVPGTYDSFRIWMQADSVQIVGNVVTISGTAKLWKNGELIINPALIITIDPDNLAAQFHMTLDGYWINGSLTP